MAGEPILVASNCAVVSVIEPLSSGTLSADNSPDFGMMTLLAEAIGAPVLQLVSEADFVVDDDLFSRIAEMKRRTLILCGGLLEGAVTQIALAALLEGYDTYICADQTVTADTDRESVFLERIRFCNGHIVTTRQVLLELLSQEKDPLKRAPLESLLGLGAAS
jgi:nicotinamidase-related amidase